MVKIKGDPLKFHQEDRAYQHGLILYNDEVNSFDFVIASLVEVCKHEFAQAEQCAMIAHFKGKCHVKNGDYEELKPMYEELTLRGLTVSIE
ncbi:MAG: ATP-dependent Clp protease adaptor ClpS [Bacteroidota bacterium]